MFADRIETPLLMLSGEGDWNVPATNQREMYYRASASGGRRSCGCTTPRAVTGPGAPAPQPISRTTGSACSSGLQSTSVRRRKEGGDIGPVTHTARVAVRRGVREGGRNGGGSRMNLTACSPYPEPSNGLADHYIDAIAAALGQEPAPGDAARL